MAIRLNGWKESPRLAIVADMRATKRRRPRRKKLLDAGVLDLHEVAAGATYVGSSEHKRHPSFAGPPKLRSDASQCDPSLGDRDQLTRWLRDAIRRGRVGAPIEGQFPRYVWISRGEDSYEARLLNREQGQYKGYPVSSDEVPSEA